MKNQNLPSENLGLMPSACRQAHSHREGFTLVELAAAILLTALLTALLMPAMQGTRCHGNRRSTCMNNVRQIGLAFKQYALDHHEVFPGLVNSNAPATSASVFLALTNGGYLSVGKIYHCPSDKSRAPACVGGSLTSSNNSYACVVADSTGLSGLSESVSSEQPLIMDDGLAGAPGLMINLTNAVWKASSAHGGDGGNVFYNGGQAAFRKRLDCGLDETNGYILLP